MTEKKIESTGIDRKYEPPSKGKFLALIMVDVLEGYLNISMTQFLGLSHFFNNFVVATLYLAIPYILMIALDIHTRNMVKQNQNLELLTESFLENAQS